MLLYKVKKNVLHFKTCVHVFLNVCHSKGTKTKPKKKYLHLCQQRIMEKDKNKLTLSPFSVQQTCASDTL